MTPARVIFSVALALALGSAPQAWGVISGGGPAATDCYAEWSGVTASSSTKPQLDCTDGDPSCDADGTADGRCTFNPNACVFQSDVTGCTPVAVLKLTISKSLLKTGKFVTSALVAPTTLTAVSCGTAATIVLPLNKGGRKPSKRLIYTMKATTGASGKLKRDSDKLILRCVPPGGTTTTTLPCPANTAGGPNEFRYDIVEEGSDLDNGWSGQAHNQPIVFGTQVHVCLKDCDAASSTPCTQNDDQDVTNKVNGRYYGAPLPLVAANVPVCVVNEYATPKITGGTFNFATGAVAVNLHLLSHVYYTSQNALCPRCSGGSLGAAGHCDVGANAGKACVTDGLITVPNKGLYTVSTQCPPSQSQAAGTLIIPLNQTTDVSTLANPTACTGQSQADDCGGQGPCNTQCAGSQTCDHLNTNGDCVADTGGVSQLCCAAAPNKPCFPATITRTGDTTIPTPAAPADTTFPKCGTATLAATFCESATTSSLINTVTGLPGPGAGLFPIKYELKQAGNADCP